jgi:cyclase
VSGSDGPRTPLGEAPAFEAGARELAPGTWGWLQPNGGLGESNAGLVVGDGESLLVDTLWDDRLTARMLAGLQRAAPDAPIRTLFNTHGDGDHWYGNGMVDGVEIVATEAAAAQMEDEPPAMLRRLGPLPKLAGLAGAVPLLPGRERLLGLARFGAALDNYEFSGLEPRLPDRRFSGTAALEIGGRTVELIEVGPAHTHGDAIAWVPDERVVFSGDIVFSEVTPIMWAGPVERWIEALERIEALDPRVVLGGHGPPCAPERLGELRDYFSRLAEQVPADGDCDATELAAELIGSSEYRAAPWGSWLAPERTAVTVAMISRTRRGRTGPLGTRERIGLISAMGALAHRLESRAG